METFVPEQASEAVGESNVQGVPNSTVLLAAHVRTGAVVSMIRTVWLQVAELEQESVARQVRVTLKVAPHAPTLLVRVLTT